MNKEHLEYCSSAEWAEAVRRWIIPGVLERVDLGQDVLEVGPGPGRTTEVLRDLAPRLTAVEVDADLADALAKRMQGTNVTVVRGDATALPFEDGRFTGAVSFTMLHHVPSAEAQDRLLAEVARVLQPGATFAGCDSLDSAEWRAMHVGDVCVPVDPDGFEGRLKTAGFSSAHTERNRVLQFRATR